METKRRITLSDLYSLDDTTIESHLQSFLSDDSDGNVDSNILFDKDFLPDTFTVQERISGTLQFIGDNERDSKAWITSMIKQYFIGIQEEYIIDSHDDIVDYCYTQIMRFLLHKINGNSIASLVTNQELPDVISKIIAYVLTGNPQHEIYSYRKFNDLAMSFLPSLVSKLHQQDIPLKSLLCYCIASGLIGLDLKGSTAAASDLATIAVPLRQLLDNGISLDDAIWTKLKAVASRGLSVDYWDNFYEEVVTQRCKLVWFMDDYIESFFDLLFIQELVTQNPSLVVTVIAKRGHHANDMAYSDVLEAINLPLFRRLKDYESMGRVIFSPHGPSMSTVNLRKLSKEVVAEVSTSDYVLVKGCRAHELIQGGLNKVCYTAYVVAREFSEAETGFDSRLTPLLFFRLEPGEYAYWGFRGRAERTTMFTDGRIIKTCYSTLQEHEARKKIDEPRAIVDEINKLLEMKPKVIRDGYIRPYLREIRPLVERLVDLTRLSYNLIANQYQEVRNEQPHKVDRELFDELLILARNLVREGKLGDEKGTITLLDVGTGPGRDLRYFRKFPDIEAFGIDNSDAFIRILSDLAEKGEIPRNSFAKMDMRNLGEFKEATFDVVRHNATLLHLPLIADGLGVDEAISESYRVLKPFGLLFVNVKMGQGMEFVDTGEGLGGRFFQFFSEQSLKELLERHKFSILSIRIWHEERPSGRIDWLAVYAQKSM